MQYVAALLAVCVLAVTAPTQLTLVIPQVCATTEGNISNAFPWGRGSAGLLHQAVYDSSHFTTQGVNYPIVITGLKWRANGGIALAATTYPIACSVRCSTCPVDWSAVTATLANQRGPDETLCFQGPVSFPAQAAVPGPAPFGIDIPLQTPFPYDPSAGDLNIECDLPIQIGYIGGIPQLDVHAIAGQANASRVYWSTGYTGYPGVTAFGINTNHAVVIEVTYIPAAGYAHAIPYGTGCINQPDVSSYELFSTSAAFDLSNTAISLIHIGTGYLAVPGVVAYVPPSGTAAVLPMTDDSEVAVTLSAPMRVGASSSTTSLVVCSNGFVSAGSGNGTTSNPVPATFLNGVRQWWSACWHNYNPALAGSGQVKFEEVAGIAFVTWDGVWDAGGTSAAAANRFQVQFEIATGNVHYVYQTMSTLGNARLVGVSDAGASADPGSMDISAALPSVYMASVFALTPLALAAGTRPVIGNSVNLISSNIPSQGVIGLTLLGMTEFTTGIDLTVFGMPTCRLYASMDVTAGFVGILGAGSTLFSIPAIPSLVGTHVLGQSAVFAPGLTPFGFITSNGLRLVLDLQ
ncbi:MAG TPA: hypothetical protein VF384_12065 [Planctomycetota bacterium]